MTREEQAKLRMICDTQNWPIFDKATVLSLLDALEAKEAEQKWIACSERMPRNGEEVFFRGRNWRTAECGFLSDDGWQVRTMSDEDTEYYLSDITHWMPMPEAP